jgi:hypothetical protein
MSDEHEHTDLGVDQKDLYGGSEGPLSTKAPETDSPKKIYPSFRYEGPTELHLPDEGTMEIHFCKTSETSRTRRDGSHWYECTIEVKCFGDVESDDDEGPEEPGTDADKALDTIARALGKEREEY